MRPRFGFRTDRPIVEFSMSKDVVFARAYSYVRVDGTERFRGAEAKPSEGRPGSSARRHK
jgi:hypothetical protein